MSDASFTLAAPAEADGFWGAVNAKPGVTIGVLGGLGVGVYVGYEAYTRGATGAQEAAASVAETIAAQQILTRMGMAASPAGLLALPLVNVGTALFKGDTGTAKTEAEKGVGGMAAVGAMLEPCAGVAAGFSSLTPVGGVVAGAVCLTGAYVGGSLATGYVQGIIPTREAETGLRNALTDDKGFFSRSIIAIANHARELRAAGVSDALINSAIAFKKAGFPPYTSAAGIDKLLDFGAHFSQELAAQLKAQGASGDAVRRIIGTELYGRSDSLTQESASRIIPTFEQRAVFLAAAHKFTSLYADAKSDPDYRDTLADLTAKLQNAPGLPEPQSAPTATPPQHAQGGGGAGALKAQTAAAAAARESASAAGDPRVAPVQTGNAHGGTTGAPVIGRVDPRRAVPPAPMS